MYTATTRQATINDLDETAELFDQYRIFYGCKPDPEGARAFLFDRFRNLESVIFIAEDTTGKAVGFTQLYPSFSSVSMKKVYILNDLFVSEKQRRNKAGSSLIKAALEYAKTMGAARVTLTTEISNTAAQSLYEKCGFRFDEGNKVYHHFL